MTTSISRLMELPCTVLLSTVGFALFLAGCDIGSETALLNQTIEPDQEGVLYTVAGIAGEPGANGNGSSATGAHLASPQDVVVSPTGEIYIIDANNHCVRLIDRDGVIFRQIGSGNPGDGSGGQPNETNLELPSGLTIGTSGDLWLSAWKNCKIKRVDPSGLTVTVAVGTSAGFSGDGGPASSAKLDHPSSLVFDESGNMYISDQMNQRIRKVDTEMNISTFAGSGEKGFLDAPGEQAKFSFPSDANAIPGGRIGWAHHPDGLLVADTENHRIRYIHLETREIYTIAGTGEAGYSGDGGSARNAQLNYPTDVLMSDDHEIFIADSRNHVIRVIDAVGYIRTVAGTGMPGVTPDGTASASARLRNPSGIYFDESNRTLYIADTGNHQVRKVRLPR